MRSTGRQRPIDLRQLCGIARAVLDEEPSIDDAEWKERIKCRLLAQGWYYPRPISLLADAMNEVEKRGRASSASSTPETEPSPSSETKPLTHEESIAALSMLAKTFKLPAMKPREMPGAESELMTTRERYAVVNDIEKLRSVLHSQRERRRLGKDREP